MTGGQVANELKSICLRKVMESLSMSMSVSRTER